MPARRTLALASALVLLIAAGVWGLAALFYFSLGACNAPVNILSLALAACGIGAAVVAVYSASTGAEWRLFASGFVGALSAFGLYAALPAISC